MIEGTGIDIIEIGRVKKAIKKLGNRFLSKVFTEGEIKYCKKKRFPEIHFAGRFAAKEAIAKAIGTGFWRGGLRWKDVEIMKVKDGRADVRLAEGLKKRLKVKRIFVSMSHCQNYAVANAIVIK